MAELRNVQIFHFPLGIKIICALTCEIAELAYRISPVNTRLKVRVVI